MQVEWNLNQLVHLKLTDKGWDRLVQHTNEVFNKYPQHQTTIEEIKKQSDADGFFSLMGHEVIKIFGGERNLASFFSMAVKIDM